MDFVKQMFTKKHQTPKTTSSNLIQVINQNKASSSQVQKRCTFLKQKAEYLREQSRIALVQNNRYQALLFLKKKHVVEKELQKTEQALMILERQIMTLESLQVEQLTINALASGFQAQKSLLGTADSTDCEKLYAYLQDSKTKEVKFNELCSSLVDNVDEDTVLDELKQLEIENLVENLPNITEKSNMLSSEKISNKLEIASRKSSGASYRFTKELAY